MTDPSFWAGVVAGVVGTIGAVAAAAGLWNWRTTRRAKHLEEHAEHKATRAERMRQLEDYLRKPGISNASYYRALAEWARLDAQGRGSSAMWRMGIRAHRVQ